MVTVYVFDITGELLFSVEGKSKTSATNKAAEKAGITWHKNAKYNVSKTIRLSDCVYQECVMKSYFFSLDKNFKVNYLGNNQNPLRYEWSGHADLMIDVGADDCGIIYHYQNINRCFLKVFSCFNPYNPLILEQTENLEIVENGI